MHPKNNSPIEQLEQELGANWVNLRKARQKTSEINHKLTDKLSLLSTKETSIVVFGSLARKELTVDSDIDWTLLIDGPASSKHLDIKNKIGIDIKVLGIKQPGQEGTFGDLAFSHDIIHKIGGGNDTNKNTTQRILLLLESTAIGSDEAYNRVLAKVLSRYITEDWGLANKKVTVPRFLLNDIMRYWRTVAVDFAYKRRERQENGWALRTIKLRMSRKLTFAAGLLICFSCATNEELRKEVKACREKENRPQIIVDHLRSLIRLSPLDILSYTILSYKGLYPSARLIIDSYDKFIELLNDPEKRIILENISSENAVRDPLFKFAREVSHDFQKGLNMLFLEDNGTKLHELTKRYGLF